MAEGVPFLDLRAQQRGIAEELNAALAPLLRDAAFVGGEPVARFEQAFAEAHGVPHAVTVKSGTAALRLGLSALGIGPGDEVIVPAYTFIATATSVIHAGATPIFADVDETTACLDPQAAAALRSPRIKAMIPVHLYGHPAPMPSLLELAHERGWKVLEDCAQSHLARLNDAATGTFGDAGAFSFYPSKNLGAGGDGGCLITRSGEVADRIRSLANHGRSGRYHHTEIGWNERLDALQAAILAVKLRHLEGWNAARRRAATRYSELLAGISPWGEPLRLPRQLPGTAPVHHLYVVRHSRRDEIAAALGNEEIGTATHYTLTLPEQPAFAGRGEKTGAFPSARAWSRTCLCLPLFPEITAEQQERVAEALRRLPA
jgi:dTDP-4-amino-4,6-dideoxygalactose transaminase